MRGPPMHGAPSSDASGLSRRAVLLPALAAAIAGPVMPVPPALAAANLEQFSDTRYDVSFGVPEGWKARPQELPDGRRLVLASDPADETNNIFVAYTPIRPDYSSLGSFGTIDFVAATVIPQCPTGQCSFKNGDLVEGRMLSSESIKDCYIYDYTIEQSRGPKRHLRSLFTIKADAGASILVGLTAQCMEDKYADLAPTFKEVIKSFKNKA